MRSTKVDTIFSSTLAVMMHVALFASLIVVLDFDRTPDVAIPLALNATLVTENAVAIPPPVDDPPQEAEPPPPAPEPDTAEQERIAAEQRQREADAAAERARLQKIEDAKAEAERQRKAEAEQRRKEAEAEQRRREEEAEQQRIEAEKQRQADIERQRQENERLRLEAEEAARREALDEESRAIEAMAASAKSAYIFAIQQKITRNWVQPANAEEGLQCTVKVRQSAGGEVLDVSFGSCNGDATVRRSIEAAVYKASPLPAPRDPSVFSQNLELKFNT